MDRTNVRHDPMTPTDQRRMRETHARLLQAIAERGLSADDIRYQHLRRMIVDARRLTTANPARARKN
jgi:thioesterase domain-containing protein